MATWLHHDRRLQIRVLLGPLLTDVTKWVTGPISIDRSTDSLVTTASVPFLNSKLPWFVAGSYSAGPQRCEIWARVVTADGNEWQRCFRGYTEAPDNSGAILPFGTLRAVSDAGRWANRSGCLLLSPFAGETRKDLLETFAANAGFTLTTSGSVTSATVKRPLDFSGITILDLLKRWGPVDGWMWREVETGVELVPLEDIAGTAATPAWAFTAGDYYSLTEAPPSRPVTVWVITAQEPALADDGTDITTEVFDGTGTGKTVWRRDISNGIMTKEVMERWEDYVVKGVTDAASDYLMVKRVTTEWTHATNGGGMPTGRLTAKITTTESYYSALSSTGTGDPPFTFQDGTFHMDNAEQFQETEKITETYVWNTTTCALESGTIETKRWLAPLSETSSSDPTNAWSADSSTRSQTEETYQVVENIVFEEGFWQPGDEWDAALGDQFGFGTANGRVRYRLEGSERGMESGTNTQFRRNWETATAWIESADGQSHQKWIRKWPGSDDAAIRSADELGLGIGEEAGFAGYPFEESREDVPEPIPLPPMDSGVSRLYTMRPILVTLTATSPLPERIQSEFNTDCESEAEVKRLARWRVRMDHSVQYTIQAPARPEMKLWDSVSFTDSVRNCSARKGWIKAIKMTLDPLTGRCDATIVIGVDTMPTVDPVP